MKTKKKSYDFILKVNQSDFQCQKAKLAKVSELIQTILKDNPDIDLYEIEMEENYIDEPLVNRVLSLQPLVVNKFNYIFIHEFSKKMQIKSLYDESENFMYNLNVLKHSSELNECIFCEKFLHTVNKENAAIKASEAATFLQERQDNSRFVSALFYHCLSHQMQIPFFFDFLELIVSLNVPFIFRDFGIFILNIFHKSKNPEAYLKHCNEISFMLHLLIEYCVINETDINTAKVHLPITFGHLMPIEWLNIVTKHDLQKQPLSKAVLKSGQNNWERHLRYCLDGVNPNEISRMIIEDDFDNFQKYSSDTKYNPKLKIRVSEYDRVTFPKSENELIELAAFYGSARIFKFLLMSKVEKTPYLARYAVAGGNVEIIRLCEQLDCDFKDTIKEAIEYHRHDIFKWLVNTKNIDIMTVSTLAKRINQSGSFRILKYVIKYGYNISLLLNDSLFGLKNDIALLLLQMKNIDVNIREKDSEGTPLHFSCKKRRTNVVKRLLEFENIEVNNIALHGIAPIHSAIRSKCPKIVKLLTDRKDIDLSVKCDLNERIIKETKQTPLQIASQHGNKDIVEVLCSCSNCDVNVITVLNFFFFIILILPFISFLMEFVAFIYSNKTSLHHAAENYGTENAIEILLMSSCIKVNSRTVLFFLLCLEIIFLKKNIYMYKYINIIYIVNIKLIFLMELLFIC